MIPVTTIEQDVVEARLVCSDVLTGVASSARVLRAFDQLRRELSRQVCGDEGMFAGYDRIDFGAPLPDDAGPVYLHVALREDFGRTHSVEYFAVAYDPTVAWDPERAAVRLVAHGSGRTMRLQRRN